MKLKSNPYNILIPIFELNEFLLYNTFSGGLEILSDSEGELLGNLISLKEFEIDPNHIHSDLIQYFVSKEYFIESQVDFIKKAEDNYLTIKNIQANDTIFLTIGTTISCNMDCPYCFEFVKPKRSLNDMKVIEQIPIYLTQLIKSKVDVIFKKISVTWYGGEPLMSINSIINLSPLLREFASKNNMLYDTNIITNGIYLTPDKVAILVEHGITKAQVTIDGAKDVHELNRPLKAKNKKNYIQILENLALLPKDFSVNIRINIDKNVANSLDELLNNLRDYGIWPNRYKNFSFTPAWLRTYDGEQLTEELKNVRLSVDEFFEAYQNFRLKQIDMFNNWASQEGGKNAKLSWDLPKYQADCPTWVNPNGLVIDPLGNIHKCWETIHDEKLAPSNVFNDYDSKGFESYTSFNRFEVNEICRNCKFLPVCDQISCAHHATNNNVPQCTYWKYKTEDFIKEQYIKMKENPSLITQPKLLESVNTGHSNK